MIDIDAELLDLDAGWRVVLEAYQEVEETGGAEPDESTTDDQGMASDDGPDRGDGEPMIGLAELVADVESKEWLPRVVSLEGFDGERLSSLHGRLIALGWLGFDVGDSVTGIRYQLTRDGQRVLDGLVPIPTLRVVAATDDGEPPPVDTERDPAVEVEVVLTADSDSANC
jgi:hypothetical protein|tara:strand:- start:1104 stop:1613 length:510 start_codon:yes stop_codon:yes gene_type:complete